MSLPNWQLAHASDAVVSPMTGVHSEKVIVLVWMNRLSHSAMLSRLSD